MCYKEFDILHGQNPVSSFKIKRIFCIKNRDCAINNIYLLITEKSVIIYEMLIMISKEKQ